MYGSRDLMRHNYCVLLLGNLSKHDIVKVTMHNSSLLEVWFITETNLSNTKTTKKLYD